MYAASLNGDDGGERFYLRILLHHVKGPKSFEAKRTVDVNGQEQLCQTFKQVPTLAVAPLSVNIPVRP